MVLSSNNSHSQRGLEMKKVKVNIRVYCAWSRHNEAIFVKVIRKPKRRTEATSIDALAVVTRLDFDEMQEKGFEVSIDFSPRNDIERQPNDNFGLCFPLTEEERLKFWEVFRQEHHIEQ